jgi:4-hydroxybenzoate polyprenyltransferase
MPEHRQSDRLGAWVRLTHPFPSLVVAFTGVGLAWEATSNSLPSGDLVRLFGLFLCSQLTVGTFNEYCDAPLDAVGKPGKPIPSGQVPRTAALGLAIALSLVTLGLGLSFGLPTLGLTILGTGAGLIYDYPLKRTRWSWLPYVVGIPILPLWAWTAVGVLPRSAIWAYPIGTLLALALHLANALPDDAGDRAAGAAGLVQLLGMRRARLLLGFAYCTALVLIGIVLSMGPSPSMVAIALIACGMLIGTVGVVIALRPRPSRLGFGALAVGAGLLALGVVAGIGR